MAEETQMVAVAHVVSTTESQLGPVDILVNNAGDLGPVGYDWDVRAFRAEKPLPRRPGAQE